jgi:hypothetical protein
MESPRGMTVQKMGLKSMVTNFFVPPRVRTGDFDVVDNRLQRQGQTAQQR